MKNPKHFSVIYENGNHQLRISYMKPQVLSLEYVGRRPFRSKDRDVHYTAKMTWLDNAETIKQIILSHVRAINTMNNANFDYIEISSDIWQKLTGKKPRRSIRK